MDREGSNTDSVEWDWTDVRRMSIPELARWILEPERLKADFYFASGMLAARLENARAAELHELAYREDRKAIRELLRTLL